MINNKYQNELRDVPKTKRDKALKRFGLIQEFAGFCRLPGRVRSEAITAFCTQKKVPVRTFQRWLARYKIQGITGLVDMRGSGKFITQTISEEAFELFKSMYLTEQQLSVKTCWQNVSFHGKNQKLNWRIPPLAYMYRIIKQRIPMPVQVLHREGLQAYEAKCAPYIQRDPDSIEPGEVWVGDHHQFNCKIFHRGSWQRPWLTAWEDMRSRCIVGFHLSFNPNQTTVLLSFKRAVEKFGPPDSVKIDNGRDYDSEMFTGTTKVKRRMLRAGYLDEQMLAGIYAMMNITISFAKPYHPQAKSIERFFDTLDCQFTKTFKTYCGKDADRKPEDHNETLTDPQLATELTLERFTGLLGRYIEAYNATAHTGAGMEGRSPAEVLATRQSQRVLAEGVADLLLGIWKKSTAGKNGVRVNGMYYGQYDVNLLMHQGKEVLVNYDPADVRQVKVYETNTYNLLAIAEQNRLIGYGRAVDEESLREASRQKTRALRITRQFTDSRLAANMDLTDLTIAAMRDAAASRTTSDEGRVTNLRPVITPLNKQVREVKRQEAFKAVRKAVGAEDITHVLNMDLSLLKGDSKTKFFNE